MSLLPFPRRRIASQTGRHRTTPHAEPLESRRLLAFNQGPVLKEAFDDLTLTPAQLLAPSGWDDNQTVPNPNGASIPLFHHTIVAVGSEPSAALGFGGTTTFQNWPTRELDLAAVQDTITFPNLNPGEGVALAALDVRRNVSGSAIAITFFGSGGSETITDLTVRSSLSPPEVIGISTGPTGKGPPVIGVLGGINHNGWDAIAATSSDVLPDGHTLGAISSIVVAAPAWPTSAIDNVRILITSGGSPITLNPGDPDPTFNQDGQANAFVGTDAIYGGDGEGALQPDGRIVVVGGGTTSNGTNTLVLVRFSTVGQPESTVYLPHQFHVLNGYAIAIDGNSASADYGDIIVAGTLRSQTGIALARFRPDLSLDTSFGTGGVEIDTRLANANAAALLIQPDDAIVVGGIVDSGTAAAPNYAAFLSRFTPDGTPDTSFASQGLLTSVFGGVRATLWQNGLALQNNGDIVAAGSVAATLSAPGSLMVARFTTSGQADRSFGINGIRTTQVAGLDNVGGVAIDPARGIVVAGSRFSGPLRNTDFFAIRYDFQGNPDPSFNNRQAQTVDLQDPGQRGGASANAIAVQPDGKILVAGSTAIPVPGKNFPYQPAQYALIRLNTDGSLDTGFGTGGKVVDGFGGGSGGNSVAESVLVQSNGDIVLTGSSESTLGSLDVLSVARFIGGDVPVTLGGGRPPAPVSSGSVYELPQGAAAGQSFASTQITVAGWSFASVLGSSTTTAGGATLHARLIQGPAHDPGFQLNDDGTFTYSPDSTFTGTDSFSFVANDGTSDSAPADVTIVTQGSPQDTDGDGVPDVVEVFAPSLGDGTIVVGPDYLLPKVASLVGGDGRYWTLVTSNGSFDRVANQPLNPVKPAPPQNVSLPAGLFGFRIVGLSPGEPVVVTLTPEGNSPVSGFYEFNDPNGTWTQLGADVAPGGATTLHLTDGHAEDLDGQTDGTITVLGGPAGTLLAQDIHQSVPHHALGSVTIATNAVLLNNNTPVQLILVQGPGNDPAHGSVTIHPSTDSFVYTSNFTPEVAPGHPLAGWSNLIVSDSFAYQVEINGQTSPVARVYIEPVNQAPTVGSFSTEIAHDQINQPLPLGNLLQRIGAADPDSDPVWVVGNVTSGSGNLGPDSLGDGGVTYRHDPTKILPPPTDNYDLTHGLVHDIFTVEVADPYLATATATIDLVIHDFVPDKPRDYTSTLAFGQTPIDQPLSYLGGVYLDPVNQVLNGLNPAAMISAIVVDQPRQPNGQSEGTAWIDHYDVVHFRTSDQHFGSVTFYYAISDGIAYGPKASYTIEETVADPVLVSDVYTVAPGNLLAAGDTNKVYNINGMDIPNTQPSPLANDTFPNGQPIAPYVVQVLATTYPSHGAITSPFYTGSFSRWFEAPPGTPRVNPIRLDHDGVFFYKPDDGFEGWDSFTYNVVFDNTTPTAAAVTVLIHVTSDAGSSQTTADLLDPTAPGQHVSLTSAPDNTVLVDAHADPLTAVFSPPPAIDFPFGFFSFEVAGLPVDGRAVVALTFPSPLPSGSSYYKYDNTQGWQPFHYNAVSMTGAKTSADDPTIPPNVVELFLVDGQFGDDDGTPNGVIVDPGAIGVPGYFRPIPSLAGPAVAVSEQPLEFSLSTGDLSAPRLAAGFTYTINWGDGTPVDTITRRPGNAAGVPLEHAYTRIGTYQVVVTATDAFGNVGQPFTVPVSIRAVALEPDPLQPGRIMLAVGGTNQADRIRVRRVRGGGLRVMIDGADLGTFHPTGRVEVWGGPGNEDIRLGPHVCQSAWLVASNGRDILIGGAGNDVLIAGAGHDLLFGRGGRNVLVVGHRRDVLFAHRGRDLLVRSAALASNPIALASVAAHWSSTRHHRSTRLFHENASLGRPFAHRPTR
jgi:uncharacterized delta-60 repeat protein